MVMSVKWVATGASIADGQRFAVVAFRSLSFANGTLSRNVCIGVLP
jgi:hypothetical protein